MDASTQSEPENQLAIMGGVPVRNTVLPYGKQSIDDEDRQAVDAVLRGDWLTTGPYVKAFEDSITDFSGAKHGVAVSTGTAALHAALHSIDIAPGDEVIVPAISFVATSNCVLYMGATPVFADLQKETLNISPDEILKKITSRTRAVVAVDFAGHPCDHDAIRDIAKKHSLTVVSDAAHSLGATYKGRKVGVLQDLTALSFHPVKHITTGEGGMVLTDDVEIDKRLRSFRHHGIDLDLHKRNHGQTWRYDVVTLGFNYRIPDINCALGTAQMQKLPRWLERRREIVAAYEKALGELDTIEIPTEQAGCSSAWHLYVIRLNLDKLSVGRKEFFSAVRAENIGVNVHYIPIPWMSYYHTLGYRPGDWAVAEAEYERMISLPIFPAMTEQDVDDVIAAIKKVSNAYRSRANP
jgi:UDP-4-amino-4,6-dideoxy-N-acetyl-beta-L-altrosamine transaminase